MLQSQELRTQIETDDEINYICKLSLDYILETTERLLFVKSSEQKFFNRSPFSIPKWVLILYFGSKKLLKMIIIFFKKFRHFRHFI
jgi:hypothetical protein